MRDGRDLDGLARQVDAVGGEAVNHRAERLAQHGRQLKRKPRAAVRRAAARGDFLENAVGCDVTRRGSALPRAGTPSSRY